MGNLILINDGYARGAEYDEVEWRFSCRCGTQAREMVASPSTEKTSHRRPGRQPVSIVRTILAAVISVSVAVMPAAAGAVPVARSIQNGISEVAPSAAMPDDCDHHPAPGHRGSKAADDCASMAACAAKCFNYTGTVLPSIALAPTASRLQPVAAARFVVSKIDSPPFRPPRV